jgi:hypothetical protein
MMPLDILINQIQEKINNIPYFTRLFQIQDGYKVYKLIDHENLYVRLSMKGSGHVTLHRDVPENEVESGVRSFEILYQLEKIGENARRI